MLLSIDAVCTAALHRNSISCRMWRKKVCKQAAAHGTHTHTQNQMHFDDGNRWQTELKTRRQTKKNVFRRDSIMENKMKLLSAKLICRLPIRDYSIWHSIISSCAFSRCCRSAYCSFFAGSMWCIIFDWCIQHTVCGAAQIKKLLCRFKLNLTIVELRLQTGQFVHIVSCNFGCHHRR